MLHIVTLDLVDNPVADSAPFLLVGAVAVGLALLATLAIVRLARGKRAATKDGTARHLSAKK